MTKQQLEYLLGRYLDNALTFEEREEWLAVLNDNQLRTSLEELIDDNYYQLSDDALTGLSPKKADEFFAAIVKQTPHLQTEKPKHLWRRLTVAASVLLVLSAGAYFVFNRITQQALIAQNKAEAISPANHGVLLTLAGGKQVNLALKYNGQIAAVGNTQINQTGNALNYEVKGAPGKSVAPNILTNNSGHKFSVTLSDGTEATLDVASSLTYPTNFSGSERLVSMTGQVYFKVIHNADQPFRVSVAHQVIEDIGTQFNVDAYKEDASATTTLIEGAVKVKPDADKLNEVLLKPGEEAVTLRGNLKVLPANIEETTAWLQGKLIFHHETLENIMRRVARIYDVELIWQDDEVRKLTFGGSVSRAKKLSTVLNFFRQAGNVDFTVEGRTVKIFKKKK